MRVQDLQRQNKALARRLGGQETILGQSPALLEALDLIKRVASADLPILLRGETGTGKELFARSLHQRSHRAKKPFVSVNCAALPLHLLESELFGHCAGAFSGATRSRAGRFAAAEGRPYR